MAKIESYFRDLVEGRRRGWFDRFLMGLLTLLSVPYELLLRLRARAYAAGILTSHSLHRPVISVGNLTVGGTGKTPAVAMLAKYFIARGKRVAVLSRGYGGSLRGEAIVSDGETLFLSAAEAGDEPYLLASTVPGLMMIVGANRFRAGVLAKERLAPDIFILDDGFQHLRLKRTLDILLLDCSRPFGNGRTLPAGLLREPSTGAERADIIIYTRCSGDEEPDCFPGKPACRAFHHLVGVSPLKGGELRPFGTLKGFKGMAFAGIADPAAFFRDLEEEGLTLATTLSFSDHCRFGEREVREILHAAEKCGADYLISTEKDGVKLMPHRERLGNIYTATLEMWVADPGPLLSALEKLL
ncbi:MAG TPA: tetraacyldisaccharide 4'-kinase [Geobacteraceae bacterium]|nr:tetraacyldisaccharide 4'-kinase [Geobacteraceae bacterium]